MVRVDAGVDDGHGLAGAGAGVPGLDDVHVGAGRARAEVVDVLARVVEGPQVRQVRVGRGGAALARRLRVDDVRVGVQVADRVGDVAGPRRTTSVCGSGSDST